MGTTKSSQFYIKSNKSKNDLRLNIGSNTQLVYQSHDQYLAFSVTIVESDSSKRKLQSLGSRFPQKKLEESASIRRLKTRSQYKSENKSITLLHTIGATDAVG
ncbi:unnamed protein product [Rhizophagus irregularis]|nr:unnamed protein product [Rhizophagus irregularis]